MITSRRYDLDWLRVFAFGVLIYFHTAIIFIPDAVPLIRNGELSSGLQVFVSISSQFRLSLLFFISGVGVAFARRNRSTAAFVLERSKRLLLPLVFSIFIVVPPMVYTEKLFIGDTSGTFSEFYGRLFSEGVYPSGNLSWHHMWFVAYLYLFCLLGVNLFAWLERDDGKWLAKLGNAMQAYWIFLPVLPLWVVELFLRPVFPGFRDLIHDWASFSHWFIVFVCGYLIANKESLLNFAERIRIFSLGLAVGSIALMYIFYGGMDFVVDWSDQFLLPKYIANTALRSILVWSSILACLGVFSRHCRMPSKALQYLNEAVYPLFILHLPVIVILGYWVVQTDWAVWAKYLFIANTTAPLILLCYHFCIRPFNAMRVLFGVRPRPVSTSKHSPNNMVRSVPPYES